MTPKEKIEYNNGLICGAVIRRGIGSTVPFKNSASFPELSTEEQIAFEIGLLNGFTPDVDLAIDRSFVPPIDVPDEPADATLVLIYEAAHYINASYIDIIPFYATADNIEIDWGDGTITNSTSEVTHRYVDNYVRAFTITIRFTNLTSFKLSPRVAYQPGLPPFFLEIYGQLHSCANLTSLTNFLTISTIQNSNGRILLTKIPNTLFDSCINVTDFSYCFSGCGWLEYIPSGLFKNCKKATNFRACFQRCDSIQVVPDDLFKNCTEVIDFSFCFDGCRKLIFVGNIFETCSKSESFRCCFDGCLSLIIIPSFEGCPNVIEFSACFKNCYRIELTADMFNNNNKAIYFASCFYNDYLTVGRSPKGTAPELWLRENILSNTSCFYNCTKLSNYNDIPEDWK